MLSRWQLKSVMSRAERPKCQKLNMGSKRGSVQEEEEKEN